MEESTLDFIEKFMFSSASHMDAIVYQNRIPYIIALLFRFVQKEAQFMQSQMNCLPCVSPVHTPY